MLQSIYYLYQVPATWEVRSASASRQQAQRACLFKPCFCTMII